MKKVRNVIICASKVACNFVNRLLILLIKSVRNSNYASSSILEEC